MTRKARHRILGVAGVAALLLGSLAASPAAGAPPAGVPGDDLTRPIAIAHLPFAHTSQTGAATVQDGEPDPSCGPDSSDYPPMLGVPNHDHSVWFAYTPAVPTLITADTLGSGYDTLLAVYQASLGREVACSDDILEGITLTSRVSIAAQAHTTYYFQVSSYGWPSDGGGLRFRVNGSILPLYCRGELVTIFGTGYGDILVGTHGDDVIAGLGGGDLILAYGGDDLVCAGPGDDVVYGGAGADRVFGEAGHDEIHGGPGPDRIYGGNGDDLAHGNAGDDVAFGMAGDDVLHGDYGWDRLVGGPGVDLCFSGEDVTC